MPIAAQGQQAGDAAQQGAPQPSAAQQAATDGPFGIPAEVVRSDHQDPNMRTATAKVNGTVITGTDIDHRVALVLAASERKEIPADQLQALRMQVLRNLIDETLQIQAAAAQDMEVSSEEVNQRYAILAQQNFGSNPQQMDKFLIAAGSSPATLKRQIQGEIAW